MEASSLTPYKNEDSTSFKKRFFSFFIDGALVILSHFLVFFLALLIYNQTPTCLNKQKVLNENANACYALEDDSRVYIFTGQGEDRYKSKQDESVTIDKWTRQHIKLTFKNDPSAFIEAGVTSLDSSYDNIEEANYQNDHLGYYYDNFIRRRNDELQVVSLDGKTPNQYYVSNIFKELAPLYPVTPKETELLWIYDEVGYSLPTLTSKAAYQSYKAIKDPSDGYALGYLTYVKNAYRSIHQDELNKLSTSPGFKRYYDAYNKQYHSILLDVDACSLIGFILSFNLVYALPMLFTRKHTSLGKRMIGVMVIDSEGRELSKRQAILRPILKAFPFFGLTLISNFLVQGTNSVWMQPMFYLGSLPISLLSFDILFLIIMVISFILTLFLPRHASFSDLLLKTTVIDDVDIIE